MNNRATSVFETEDSPVSSPGFVSTLSPTKTCDPFPIIHASLGVVGQSGPEAVFIGLVISGHNSNTSGSFGLFGRVIYFHLTLSSLTPMTTTCSRTGQVFKWFPIEKLRHKGLTPAHTIRKC